MQEGRKKATRPRKRVEAPVPEEIMAMARRALQDIRASEPLTISDLPEKKYTVEEIMVQMERCCSALAEHMDTVQLFVTKHMNGRTSAFTAGAGNEFARVAHVQSWLEDVMGGAEDTGGL